MEKIDWDSGTLASRRQGGHSNIVTTWKIWAKYKYGSLSAAYEELESHFNGTSVATNISRWERGVRRLPPSVANYMIHDVLPVILRDFSDPYFIEKKIRLPKDIRHEQ